MENSSDKDFDEKLLQISTLNWKPWIGLNYSQARVLILGDSHYEDGDEWLDDPNATRNMITNQGLNSSILAFSKSPLLRNIEKTILHQPSTTYEERAKFWKRVSYVNLVQRLLPSREPKNRPTDDDFDIGWKTILSVSEIIRPTVCIKLAIDGIGRLGYYLNNNDTDWKWNKDDFSKRPCSINLQNFEYNLKIIFINHPTGSYGFDYEHWAQVIENEVPHLRSAVLQ
ncbi:MAG: hypothetical protein HOP08_05795 [Cyclobacteriaceae bacterium]|nr:hypothetical protein [Cyclobacteriaceae bacterium]